MTEWINTVIRLVSGNNGRGISPDSRREVVTRLKFIGSLSASDKIDCNNIKIENNSIFTPFKRFLVGDGRDVTLGFFTSTIDRSIEIINGTVNSKGTEERIFVANLVTDLVGCIKGLRSSQKTYATDKLFCCEIDVLIEQVQAKILSLQQDHPDLFTIKDLCVVDIKSGTFKPKISEPYEKGTFAQISQQLSPIEEESDMDDSGTPLP